jgi:ABC-type glutathione transport system ATPase component
MSAQIQESLAPSPAFTKSATKAAATSVSGSEVITKADAILLVKDLKKIFEPNVRAVDGISFDVKRGEVFGFLGPNGAG